MEVADLKRLKELEEEHRRLKQMYADLSLDHTVLKDIVKTSSTARCTTRPDRICSSSIFDQPAAGLPGPGLHASVYRYQPDLTRDDQWPLVTGFYLRQLVLRPSVSDAQHRR